MLESKTKWQFTNQEETESELTLEELPIKSSIIVDLLKQRGLNTTEEMNEFISPKLDNLASPQGLSMVEQATERIHQAINYGEKILVYGDYDADGICSTALLLKSLYELGATCDYYIPNRIDEGYGLNEDAFKQAYTKGFKVILTVDTGIASIKEAELAKQLGMDLIITDHHEVQDQLPNAYAIINPKCSPDYAFKELAGVGVAFKLAEHLLGYFPEHLLDLVAIGTIADLVPLINENRILAHYGLQQLTKTKNVGLQALKKNCNIDGHVTEENIGFLLGPRINATGRISDAEIAVQLLMTNDREEADQIAEKINSINQKRQKIVSSIVQEAEQMLQENNKEKVIMIAHENWHEGVLGIVASRLVQKYDRPAIVLTYDQETSQYKGSARSIPAFNLFKNCMEIRELFSQFGGHSQAAGMTFPSENFQMIQDKLNLLITEQLSSEDFKQVTEISRSVTITDLNEQLFNDISLLAPYGVGNPKPIFHLNDIPEEVRQIGQNKNHLKLQFFDEKHLVEGIGFGMGDLFNFITPQTTISIVGEFGINEWNGVRTPQIVMKDMKIDHWQLFDHRGKKNIDLSAFIHNDKCNLMISNEQLLDTQQMENVDQITYRTEIESLSKVNSLYIYDLPPTLDQLEKIVSVTKPENIHVCFYIEKSMFLKSFPSRNDFKWYYALIHHRKKLDLTSELSNIMKSRGWRKEKLRFMTQVFLELDFVTKDNDVIYVNSSPIKKDLQQSSSYQKLLNECKVEKTLYYSTYKELREWFNRCMNDVEIPKEEVVHGL